MNKKALKKYIKEYKRITKQFRIFKKDFKTQNDVKDYRDTLKNYKR